MPLTHDTMTAALRADQPSGRAYTCGGCSQTRITPTLTGPYPRVCDDCLSPDQLALRQAHRRNGRAGARRRATRVRELEQRVTDLEAVLHVDHDRVNRHGEPGRDALARAVMRLGRRGDVQGPAATRDALLTIVAIALAWAARLEPVGSRSGREAA